MCFSPTASFVSSAVIGSIGVATLYQSKSPRAILMASTPLLFGAQQMIEGFIWLKIGHMPFGDDPYPIQSSPLLYLYCFFAFILWPTFSPVAVAILERGSVRKHWFLGFIIVGVITSIYFSYELFRFPLVAFVSHHHIEYHLNHRIPMLVIVLYCVASVASCFFSRHKWIVHYGWILLLSLIASYIAYTEAFASVWCFFAAILSAILYLHFSRSAKALNL